MLSRCGFSAEEGWSWPPQDSRSVSICSRCMQLSNQSGAVMQTGGREQYCREMLSVTKLSLTPGKMAAIWRPAARGQYNTSLLQISGFVSVSVCPLGDICLNVSFGFSFSGNRCDNLPAWLPSVSVSRFIFLCAHKDTHDLFFDSLISILSNQVISSPRSKECMWTCFLSECECGHERWCVPPTQSHNRLRQ